MNAFWMGLLTQIGGTILGASVPILVTVLAALAAILGKWVVGLIKKSQSQLDDKIAAWCVAWAEDKFGSGKGEEKLEEACDKIQELTKGRIKHEQAEVLIRAAYQALYGELKNLKNG